MKRLRTGASATGRGPGRAKWWMLIVADILVGLAPVGAADIRWAASSNRIYVTGPGMVQLGEIKTAQGQAPLEEVAPGVWHLRANLVLEDGAQLILHGTGIGGDVNQLRLQSNNSSATNRFVFVSADWGSIHIQGTSITSWDDGVNGPDTEYAAFGRAFIGVRSRLAQDGVTPLESRMDIVDSDIGYLGYDESEAYGLSWKVVGAEPGLFDRVDVRGDITGSFIHHNYFGVYTFGAHGMQWRNNEIAYNVQYGFDPHDDSDHLLIEGNNAHHNGNHGIIASKRCDHLIIRNNASWANGQNGIILHRSSDDCVIENNRCFDNADTGIVLAGSSRNLVRSNLLARNFEAGLRLNLGSADNLIENNESVSNSWYGFYLYKGDDEPEPNDDGRPKRNRFVGNRVEGNGKEAISLADSDDNAFATNSFFANGAKFRFERGFRNRLDGNEIPNDVTVRTEGSLSDAASTHVRNQPSLRVQVDEYSSMTFEDDTGRIFDPEENNLGTGVTTNGSTLVLTAAEIGTTSTVVTRSFWVQANLGTVLVNPTSWQDSGSAGKQWTVEATAPGESLTQTIGDLGVRTAYAVHKDGVPLTAVLSDSVGTVAFADLVGTTNRVSYSLEPTFLILVERVAQDLFVSWSTGRLQQAASLSPPNWLEVPVTNGQSKLKLNTTDRAYFRAIQP